MGDDVMGKADALMRRHRVFVAGAPEQHNLLAPVEGEDVPVLTEVVSAAAPRAADEAAGRLRELLSDHLALQRTALAAELTAWLDTELPRIVTAMLDGVTDQLVAKVTAEARAALLPRLQAALEPEQAAPPAAE